MWAVTCHRCRNASRSASGIGTFQTSILFMQNVARLCQVTSMSAWLIGSDSSVDPFQCPEAGSR